MSRYKEFLTARRAQRRREWKRGALRAAVWFLTFSLGATTGWLGRDWHLMHGAMRRPGPTASEPAADPAPNGPGQVVASTSGEGSEPPDEGPAAAEPSGPGQEPEQTAQAEPELTGTLQERMAALSRIAPGPSSIWFYDLTTNDTVSVQGDRLYTAASTIKVPIIMHLYHLAANNRVSLDREIAVEQGDWAAGTGILQGAPDGDTFSLRELARLAIIHSDNIAANALLRTLGNEPLVLYLREIGIRHDRENNLISAKDLGLAFRHLWRMARRYPVPWEEPLTFLRQTAFNDRLPAGLPQDVPIAHKIGSVDQSFHDAGIIYHPDRPYILVVMTEGMGEKDAARYIGRVSREAWRWQNAVP